MERAYRDGHERPWLKLRENRAPDIETDVRHPVTGRLGFARPRPERVTRSSAPARSRPLNKGSDRTSHCVSVRHHGVVALCGLGRAGEMGRRPPPGQAWFHGPRFYEIVVGPATPPALKVPPRWNFPGGSDTGSVANVSLDRPVTVRYRSGCHSGRIASNRVACVEGAVAGSVWAGRVVGQARTRPCRRYGVAVVGSLAPGWRGTPAGDRHPDPATLLGAKACGTGVTAPASSTVVTPPAPTGSGSVRSTRPPEGAPRPLASRLSRLT